MPRADQEISESLVPAGMEGVLTGLMGDMDPEEIAAIAQSVMPKMMPFMEKLGLFDKVNQRIARAEIEIAKLQIDLTKFETREMEYLTRLEELENDS